MRLTKCCLDMDGVLVNLEQGICRVHDVTNPYENGYREWDIAKALNISVEELWRPCTSHEFWANLEKLPEADEIVRMVEARFGEKVVLLSTPIESPASMTGKMEWIDRHFPQFNRRYLFGPRKEFCASPTTLLIDDCEANVNVFWEHSGTAILVPKPWNNNRGLNVVKHIHRMMRMYL